MAEVQVVHTRHTVAVGQVLWQVRATCASDARSATRRVVSGGTGTVSLGDSRSQDEAVLEVGQCHRAADAGELVLGDVAAIGNLIASGVDTGWAARWAPPLQYAADRRTLCHQLG